MVQYLSEDLRVRVIRAIEGGMSRNAAAHHFGVSIASAVRWMDAYPDSCWLKLRTKHPLERIMREIRRRTRAVGAFPDCQSCLNLAAAPLRHIAGTQWSTRKDMNMNPLYAEQTHHGAVFA